MAAICGLTAFLLKPILVDLDHVAVHLNTVLAPDVDLLHRCLVYVTSFMADTAPVAASIATRDENGALPQRGELTT